jgi:murein biosynthesis integral membrane protein MurJ
VTTAPPAGTRPEPAPAGTAPAETTPAETAPAETAPAETATAGRVPGGHASLLRSSGVMAAGTLASRFTGFIRTAVLLYALGTRDLGDAYNVANTVPNAVYNLALGGILTSVAVPLIVSAAKRHSDGGQAYDQRIFTLGVLVLGAITVLATGAAVPITAVYGHGMPNAATYHLTVIFSYFFLPQIFFYGVSSLAGAILNARGSFAAPMWTPIVNNVVVVAAAIAFIVMAGLNRGPAGLPAADVQLLGIGTTLGIVAQTAALIPSLRKVGFRWRPRFDFRRAEVSEMGRMSGWMLGYIVTTQISFLVTTIVSNDAGARVCATCAGAGFAAFSNAWQLFQLPYAIVGMSVITAMLPRMSAHAAEGSYGLVTDDYSAATRLASVIIVPASLILAVLGPALAQGVFGHGSTSAASARYLGVVFAVFSLGLLPYTIFNLQMRVFYAMHDNRTPAIVGGLAMAVRIASSLAALVILPPQDVVAGLGVGFGLSNLVTAIALGWLLRRRVGGMDTRRIRSSLVRMHVAAVPGTIVALAVAAGISAVTAGGTIAALATVAVGGTLGLGAYLLAARLLRVSEISDLTGLLRARFGRAG